MIVFAGTVLFGSASMAVKDTGRFEMDGNAVTQTSDDWDEVCHQVLGGDCSTINDTNLATAVSWAEDSLLNGTPSLSASIFTGGGSKDPEDISNWAWKDGTGGLPDKANLLHSFAARYSLTPNATTCPVAPPPPAPQPDPLPATCDVLFFGSDRYDNSGDAVQAFWFFQNEVSLGTNPIGGGFGFNGVHMDGDLLIISEFSNGGTVSTINIYEWDSSVSGNLSLLSASNAANCAQVPSGFPYCGIVNSANGTTAPWPFLDKSGNSTYLQGEFFEGGVNLTLLGLADRCFASVMSETRTSTSTTSVLKDFVLGGFGECDTTLVTTPQPDTTLSIGPGASVAVQDSAQLTINGIPNWSGTLSFALCSESDLVDDLCETGGTDISSHAVDETTGNPILSDEATVTAAGDYCWRGEFDSDTEGVPDAVDASDGECFTVTPLTPEISTSATGEVEIGGAISDTATLSGTANQPGDPVVNPTTAGGEAEGTITFAVYGPDDDDCSGDPVFTSDPVAVDGDGDYPSGDFTPDAAGTYRWIASYSGDSPNTNPVSGECGDAGETSVVTPSTPTIVTSATAGPVPLGGAISDTATIANTAPQPDGSPAGGTVTFWAYGPDDPDCSGDPAFTSDPIPVSGDGDYLSGDFVPTLAGTYLWIAEYSGDPPNTSGPVSGDCGAEGETSEVIQLQPTISTEQTFIVEDSATIEVAAGAGDLDGNVRFRLYDNDTCTGTELFNSGLVPVGGATSVTVHSGQYEIESTEVTLSWLVEYTSSNDGHQDVTSACNVENAYLSVTNSP
jgi:hypothetical protein